MRLLRGVLFVVLVTVGLALVGVLIAVSVAAVVAIWLAADYRV